MSRRVIFSAASSHRRQTLLQSDSYRKAGTTRLGETVGGTAAVCCCCSFGLANIVYLAVYKVPASLCQKALKKKRRRRMMSDGSAEELMAPRRRCSCGCCDDIMGVGRVYPLCCDDDVAVMKSRRSMEKDKEVVELEKEMWERFYGTGFWRSPSQREDAAEFSSQPRISSAPNLQVLAVK